MSLPLKIAVLLALILASSLGLTALLNTVKFEKALAGVVLTRHQVTVRGLADDIETGINLGLALHELQSCQPLLERAASEAPDLLRAEIRDPSGQTLFAQGGELAGGLPALSANAVNQGWHRLSAEGMTLAEPLFNSFGQRVGILVVAFSRHSFDDAMAAMTRFTTMAAAVLIAIGTLMALLAGLALHRPFDRALGQMTQQLDGIASESPTETTDPITTTRQAIRAIQQKVRP